MYSNVQCSVISLLLTTILACQLVDKQITLVEITLPIVYYYTKCTQPGSKLVYLLLYKCT